MLQSTHRRSLAPFLVAAIASLIAATSHAGNVGATARTEASTLAQCSIYPAPGWICWDDRWCYDHCAASAPCE